MSRIEKKLIANREQGRRSLTIYLNCGDPDIETTASLIELCARHGVDVIELGVPFAHSFTDGEVVLRSHERALRNNVNLSTTLQLVDRVRKNTDIPIVLLADFSFTIKPFGIRNTVAACEQHGIDGLLLHGLPPLFMEEYLACIQPASVDPIFSLYPNSSPGVMAKTLANSRGFIYMVSTYGRTGAPIDFSSAGITHFYQSIRQATSLPLMAGFGIKGVQDMETIFSNSDIDGVIMGSAISRIIEASLHAPDKILGHTADYLTSLSHTRFIKRRYQAEV